MLKTKVAPLLLLLLVGFAACEEREVTPCSKKGRECFSYTLVCNGSGYEARIYQPSVWVATRVNDGSAYLPALIQGFWRLFRYIQGKNAAGVHIPMTGPVLTRVRDAPESREFEIYFMLPEAFRGDPPAPTEETVFVERFPELRVYARVFGGWMTDATRLAQLQYLDGQLSAHGRPLQAGRHYTAGYNSPMEIFNRRNEVWREAEGELSCSPALEE
nr:heme-binding protein 2-like [Zootoca vivipara]